MKKKFFAYMIIGILLFTFLVQGKGTKTYWFQIASQGEGESGFLTNSNLNQKKVYLTFDDGPSYLTKEILLLAHRMKTPRVNPVRKRFTRMPQYKLFASWSSLLPWRRIKTMTTGYK